MERKLTRWLVSWLAMVALAATACPGDDPESDGDADADADGESDGDTDGEADGDADGDPGPVADCSEGTSAWPCSCDAEGPCDDGSECYEVAGLEEHGRFCAAECAGRDTPCPATAYAAEGQCLMQDRLTGQWYCALVCETGADCPETEECVPMGGEFSLCI